jgi:CheY-like chemotaxis protein
MNSFWELKVTSAAPIKMIGTPTILISSWPYLISLAVEPKEMNNMKSVLVVEDHIESMELAVCLLETKGFTSEVANDGEQALELVDKYLFELIVLDLRLPKVDGYEVLQRLKRTLNSNTPVVVVTACIISENEREFLEKNSIRYLIKPYNIQQFYEATSFYLSNNVSASIRA